MAEVRTLFPRPCGKIGFDARRPESCRCGRESPGPGQSSRRPLEYRAFLVALLLSHEYRILEPEDGIHGVPHAHELFVVKRFVQHAVFVAEEAFLERLAELLDEFLLGHAEADRLARKPAVGSGSYAQYAATADQRQATNDGKPFLFHGLMFLCPTGTARTAAIGSVFGPEPAVVPLVVRFVSSLFSTCTSVSGEVRPPLRRRYGIPVRPGRVLRLSALTETGDRPFGRGPARSFRTDRRAGVSSVLTVPGICFF